MRRVGRVSKFQRRPRNAGSELDAWVLVLVRLARKFKARQQRQQRQGGESSTTKGIKLPRWESRISAQRGIMRNRVRVLASERRQQSDVKNRVSLQVGVYVGTEEMLLDLHHHHDHLKKECGVYPIQLEPGMTKKKTEQQKTLKKKNPPCTNGMV